MMEIVPSANHILCSRPIKNVQSLANHVVSKWLCGNVTNVTESFIVQRIYKSFSALAIRVNPSSNSLRGHPIFIL